MDGSSCVRNRDRSRPILRVKQGEVQGILEENVFGSHDYYSFKGIPFAAPPVGPLRFKDPEPPASWEDVRDASKCGEVSAQLYPPIPPLQPSLDKVVIGQEDCLYLNIYVPYNIYTKNGNPVMVWIHGGGYIFGTGNDSQDKPDYLMAKDVILVTISYRLGALGFLNLGHEEASGNQGLKDQVAALKWIKENIEVFSGDSNNITVFGVSAGSICTHLLTLSSLSKDLFHKAILQSGVSTCDWAMMNLPGDNPTANSFKLASKLGNDSTDPATVIKFLREKVSVDEIIQKQYEVLIPEEAFTRFVPFGPTIDDKAKKPFLPRPVSELLDNDNNIPIIVGHTSHEYIFFYTGLAAAPNALNTWYASLPLLVKNFKKAQGEITDSETINNLTTCVKRRYFNNVTNFTQKSIPSLIRFLSDEHFTRPIKDFVDRRRKTKQAPTYFYNFSYIGNQMTLAKAMGNTLTALGASHTDDLAYLFYEPICKNNDPNGKDPPAIGTNDRKILEILTRMWTNFAKTGDPTSVLDKYVTTTWRPATANNFHRLNIGDVTVQLAHISNCERVEEWEI
ncbi:PREDICTED: esterase E4-like [Wasmannia auropunctata]|uniref:esterase E4-like n=1 Tax=Wasmannia auropunctata TaxID=64793 RepID=UPI0005F00B7C|nr:PREDICTED: esterase E4-like [Wasmannia auropunctata]